MVLMDVNELDFDMELVIEKASLLQRCDIRHDRSGRRKRGFLRLIDNELRSRWQRRMPSLRIGMLQSSGCCRR